MIIMKIGSKANQDQINKAYEEINKEIEKPEAKLVYQVGVLRGMLTTFFDEPKKIDLWITTPNPILGEMAPLQFILLGKFDKLIKMVKSLLEGNHP